MSTVTVWFLLLVYMINKFCCLCLCWLKFWWSCQCLVWMKWYIILLRILLFLLFFGMWRFFLMFLWKWFLWFFYLFFFLTDLWVTKSIQLLRNDDSLLEPRFLPLSFIGSRFLITLFEIWIKNLIKFRLLLFLVNLSCSLLVFLFFSY